MTKLHEAALEYARMGWYVFPIAPGQKQPPLTPSGLNAATTDEDQINRWWTKYPDANVGINCGLSGLFAIDIDDRESFKRLEAKIGKLPTTTTSASGSGRGGHLLWKQPEEPLTNAEGGLKGQHINARGMGGYILVPPDVHPSGKPYTWTVSPKQCLPQPVPAQLIEILKQTPERRRDVVMGKLLEGQGRNNYLFAFGIAFVNKAVTDIEVRAKIAAENVHRCEPPLDDRELDTLVKSVLGYRGKTHRYIEKYGSQAGWRKISQAEINHLIIPKAEWDLEDLLPKDSGPALMIGDAGSYKSWIALHACVCSATGDKFLGRFQTAHRGNSIFVNLDAGTIPLLRRVKNLGSSLANFSVVCPGAWNPVEFEKILATNPGSFVVLDCFSDLFEGRAEGAAQASEMRKQLKFLRDCYEKFSCNGFIIDHAKRGAADSKIKTAYYGSVQKIATIRSMWHVGVPEEENASDSRRLVITCAKQSEAEQFAPVEVNIKFHADSVEFTTPTFEASLIDNVLSNQEALLPTVSSQDVL